MRKLVAVLAFTLIGVAAGADTSSDLKSWGLKIRASLRDVLSEQDKTKHNTNDVNSYKAVVGVKLRPNGEVLDVAVFDSSRKKYDHEVIRRIREASPLPSAPGKMNKDSYAFSLPINAVWRGPVGPFD
ncbi:TonB C-terminal domain-containing protein [Paracoccus alkanivorans]|nr:TonB C-terminal domain-containing protein [Paracoccus alkanivorans]